MDQPEPVEVPAAAPPKKSGKTVILILTVVLVGGAGVSGALFGPKLFAKPVPAEEAEAAEHGEEEAADEESGKEKEDPADKPSDKPLVTTQFSSIVVDLRSAEGDMHHLKVGLSFELEESFTEDDFKRLTPRGRQAAITYLRGLDYESATDAKRFDVIRKELCAKVKASFGKKKVRSVFVTDFVAQ